MPIAQINGQGIYYEDSGGADKPAVMFMHGFLFDQSMFDAQVEALQADYRCVRFDARALGQTQWDGKPFSLYDTGADCIGLMDHLGIQRAAMVGMSQGGYALVRMLVKYPERITAAVFISTYNGVDTADVKEVYRSMRDAWASPESRAGVIDVFSNLFLGADEVQRAKWRPMWNQIPPTNVFHGMNNLIDRDDVTPDNMKAVTIPALVMHGDADQGIPMALGEALHRMLGNSKGFVPIPGGTHAASLVNPAATNAPLKAFLDEYAR
ncbi:MAG: alpha/beta hydrolase [Anaerolinea sp.]|nr:alpha/beta hydrolase [Anaerolinea sp.]